MINIKNLNKIYKSKRKNNCHALKDIDLTLPSKGLVFVLGKSGSGKSTLLNLIGGLDNVTSGEIIIDDNNISKMSEAKFADYRNEYIGFIFQDYHLIDELTVYENIKLSLVLKNDQEESLIKEALLKVGLEGYDNRYPNELSGGERQRVAIARAIVKRPHIILADEPTGNLDNKTATSIIKLLKKLSKECLILIVSHNTIDAYTYADRIIELSSGQIVSDYTRNPEYSDDIIYDHEILYYPQDHLLTDDDVEHINDRIEHHQLRKVVKVKNKFIKTEKIEEDNNHIGIKKRKLSIKDASFLSFKFLKSKLVRIFTSSIMVSMIMVILSLAQTIINFDADEVIKNKMFEYNQSSIVLEKTITKENQSLLDGNYHTRIEEDDVQTFYDKGYKGNIYEVFNYTVPIISTQHQAGLGTGHMSKGIFLSESLGTIIVDEEFLVKKYGSIKYIAKADTDHPLGIIITDYIADAILATHPKYLGKKYEDILGKFMISTVTTTRVIISGIIDTGYSTRYENLIDLYKQGKLNNISNIYNSGNTEIIEFMNEIYNSLGYTYSLNPNFKNDFIGNTDIEVMWYHSIGVGKDNNFRYITGPYVINNKENKYVISGNDVYMSYTKYNEFFGTNYTPGTLKKFVPHDMTFSTYDYSDVNYENPNLTITVHIKGLVNNTALFVTSDELYTEFSKYSLMTTGLYFDNVDNLSLILDTANELNYTHQNVMLEGVHTMTKAVDVFIPIFELINIVLCLGVIFILMSFSMKMVKDKLHEIGILKALGTKNFSVMLIFGLQVILIAAATSVLATLGYLVFIDLANDVLIASLRELAPSHIVLDLHFLTFKPTIALMDSLVVFGLSILSLVIPMIKIHNIKPVKIIKSKE